MKQISMVRVDISNAQVFYNGRHSCRFDMWKTLGREASEKALIWEGQESTLCQSDLRCLPRRPSALWRTGSEGRISLPER